MSKASQVRITAFGEGRYEFPVMNEAATVGDGLRAGSVETKGRRLAVNGHPSGMIQIIGVHRHTGLGHVGVGSTPVIGYARGHAGTEGAEVGSVGGEFLHPVVVPVGDVEVSLIVDGYPPGHVHVTFSVALTTEAAKVLAILGEFLNAAVVGVNYPEVLVGVESQP